MQFASSLRAALPAVMLLLWSAQAQPNGNLLFVAPSSDGGSLNLGLFNPASNTSKIIGTYSGWRNGQFRGVDLTHNRAFLHVQCAQPPSQDTLLTVDITSGQVLQSTPFVGWAPGFRISTTYDQSSGMLAGAVLNGSDGTWALARVNWKTGKLDTVLNSLNANVWTTAFATDANTTMYAMAQSLYSGLVVITADYVNGQINSNEPPLNGPYPGWVDLTYDHTSGQLVYLWWTPNANTMGLYSLDPTSGDIGYLNVQLDVYAQEWLITSAAFDSVSQNFFACARPGAEGSPYYVFQIDLNAGYVTNTIQAEYLDMHWIAQP